MTFTATHPAKQDSPQRAALPVPLDHKRQAAIHHIDTLDTRVGSLDPGVQRLKRAEIKRRYQGPKVPWTWQGGWLTRRVTEIEMVLLDNYGSELPDDDAGFDDLRIVLFHMAKSKKHNERTMRSWITERAPWTLDDADELNSQRARERGQAAAGRQAGADAGRHRRRPHPARAHHHRRRRRHQAAAHGAKEAAKVGLGQGLPAD